MMKVSKLILYLGSLLFMPTIYSSCIIDNDLEPNVKMGWVPVYGTNYNISDIKILGPQQLVSPGKIFLRNQYLLLNERNKGIHIFDNSNPSNPTNLGFMSIPGCLDVVMRGNILFTDFHKSIVSIDLSNPTQPKVLGSLPNALSLSRVRPAINDSNQFDVYQCADSTKGIVTGWRRDSVYLTKCYNSIR